MPETPNNDALTTLLRAADPAAGDPGLDARERALMRQRVLAAGRQRSRRTAGWLAPAATAMALLALALGLALNQPRAPLPEATAGSPATSLAADSSGQQIQFTTDNGTLVVWVLQPRFAG